MRIVVDTSVLVAAMMKSARVRHVYMAFFTSEWIIPREAKGELERHLPRIAESMRCSEDEARAGLGRLLKRAAFVEVGENEPEFAAARELIGHRDPSDVAFVAACLKTEALGIWSLDKDFDGIEGVPRFTTAGAAKLLELAGGISEG